MIMLTFKIQKEKADLPNSSLHLLLPRHSLPHQQFSSKFILLLYLSACRWNHSVFEKEAMEGVNINLISRFTGFQTILQKFNLGNNHHNNRL